MVRRVAIFMVCAAPVLCGIGAVAFGAVMAGAIPAGLAVLGLAASGGAASASPALPETEGVLEAGLVDGWRDADGARVVALRIRLAPGWHTYWRVPGETGIPPQFDWSGSANLASVTYEWPRPRIFTTGGMEFFGYEGELVLPMRLVPKDPSRPIDAALDLFYGVCKTICLPAEANLAVTLDGSSASGPSAQEIRSALGERALTPGEAGIADVRCSLEPLADGYALEAEITFAGTLPARHQIALLESANPALWIGLPENDLVEDTLVATARVYGPDEDSVAIDRSTIRLTLLDDTRAVDIRGCNG